MEFSFMKEPRLVNRGVDTFIVNAFRTKDGEPIKCDLDDALAEELDGWKRQAQLTSQPYPTPWTFNHASLLMQPNGAGRGQWQWMLKTRDITLYISRGKWNGIASVRFNSDYLWAASSFMDAVVQVNAFLHDIFQNAVMHLQPSEVHLCADIANWHDITTLDRRKNFVSRSRKRGEHHEAQWPEGMKLSDFSSGLQETGFDFSQRGAMSCTIYDKTRELRKSGKFWFVDLWRLRNGWNEEEEPSVWRVEMRFKRQVLHELKQGDFHGIEDVYDLPKRFPVLWTYATGHLDGGTDGLPDGWLRCVFPNGDKNRARWPTHPAWKVVQQAFTESMAMPEHFGTIIRKRREEMNVERALEAIIGYSTSVSAWQGGTLAQSDADFSVFLHWLAENGEDLMERKGKDFSKEVRRKRVKLGLDVSVDEVNL
jgi:hypothetical protein